MASWIGQLWGRFWRWISGVGVDWGDGNPRRAAFWLQLLAIEGFAIRFFVIILIFTVIFAVGQISDFGDWDGWRQALKTFGILLGVIAASTIGGGILGFLFGIPRQISQPHATPVTPAGNPEVGAAGARDGNAQGRRFFEGNTNLEEISDWITKIIVGLSLVQARSIYDGLTAAADAFKEQALPNVEGADVVFLITVAAAASGGFLFFYLETRTRIGLLLGDADSAADYQNAGIGQRTVLNAVLNAPIVEPDADTPAGQPPPRPGQVPGAAPISEDELVLRAPYDALRTPDQLAAWGSAQARAGNFAAAARALYDAIEKKPGDRDILLRLADVRERQGNQKAALDLVSEVQGKTKDDDPKLLKRELYMSLYLPKPEGFEQALLFADRLLANPAESDPYVHVWIAAAYGQRYEWLNASGGDAEQKRDARTRALEHMKRVIALADPSHPARVLMRQLFDPAREGSPPWENDLEVFKNDPEFRKVIYPDDSAQ